MYNNNTAVNFPIREIVYIEIDKITVNPNQPRKFFKLEAITELSESIKEHGILVPLSIRYTKGRYELIAGERRLRASKMAELIEVPCIIVDADTEQSHVLSIIENIQRENLNYIEEAEAYQSLLREHGYTQDTLAKKICKNQSTIANKLRLLKLESEVKDTLLKNNLTERHARALLKLPNEEARVTVLEKVIGSSLNVSKTESLVETFLNKANDKSINFNEHKKNQQLKMIIRDVKIFLNEIKIAVNTMKKAGIVADYDVEETEDSYKVIVNIKKARN